MVRDVSQKTKRTRGAKAPNEPVVPKNAEKVTIRDEWLEHAQAIGMPIEEAIDEALMQLSQQCKTGTKIEAYRDPAFNKLVFARMPIDAKKALELRAAGEGQSVSFYATSLVEKFLNASEDDRPKVSDFETPRRGRATPDERERMNKLKKGLITVGLQLTDSEAKQVAVVAANISRQKKDALGGIIMAELKK